jgi:aryl-alcohol dehydrogenase-like predicted oxidoreductase
VTAPQASDRIPLAGSTVSLPPLGVGTWAWGDRATWGMGGYDHDLSVATIHDAWEACLEAGVVFFDTAEVYGKGESERIIGKLLAESGAAASSVVIATKFMPSPWKLDVKRALLSALRASLDRLGVESVGLYQVHGPISLRSHGAMADALAAAHAEGLVQAIGVSNYSVKETRAIDAALRDRGLRLATNQVEYSLLRRMPEEDGLIACCRELGVLPLAYSPIGEVDRIVEVLRRVGAAHGDRTPSQVALAWLIAKGAVPIPGAKNRRQAEDNAGALGWALSEAERAELDGVALHGIKSLANRFWQHG